MFVGRVPLYVGMGDIKNFMSQLYRENYCGIIVYHHICGIVGGSNNWQKAKLTSILNGGFEYCMERNPCLQPK